MGKRLIRYNASELLVHMDVLIHNEVSIVLKNGSAYHGRMVKMDQGQIQIIDFKDVKHLFSCDDIMEIITDKVTSY